jgi:hypothetical protein
MFRAVTPAILLSLLAGVAWAESVPEFSLDYAKEKANTIVVVDESGTVLESWRGLLKAGDKLHYKAIAKPLAVVEVPKILESKVKEVTGKRRVLFLIRTGGGRGFDLGPIGYAPASYLKPDISLATVWVERGECFAIYQWHNPGPGAQLHPLNMNEERLKKEVTPDKKEPAK